MAFDTDLDLLEHRLLALGQSELKLEQHLRELLMRVRSYGTEGLEAESDEAWQLYQEAKAVLAALRQEISIVEVRLYAMRRRRQK